MKILTTPWKDDLFDLVSNAKNSIKITSPFIKENICKELLEVKNQSTSFDLITSFKLMNVYSGSIDISALEKILACNGVVKNYHKLHSKIYLFDDKKAIITSGNLTNGGLINNYEYGIYLDEKHIVAQIVKDFYSIYVNENTGIIKKSDLSKAKEIISKIPKQEKTKLPNFEIESHEENSDILEIENQLILSSLKGWKLEVFKCANSIPTQIFTLNEINQSESYLKTIYPTNNTITDKIRQQLQYLRDLGLIEFLGNGKYKKLWK